MDNPGSCNTDSFLGNHPNKILIIKPSITFNTQDYPVEWVIFPTITLNIPSVMERTSYQSQKKIQNIQDVVGENWADDTYYL